MDTGIGLPAMIAGVEVRAIVDWARRGEERGFASLGTIDRIVYGNHEPLTSLAAAAAVTSRVRLTHRGGGTAVPGAGCSTPNWRRCTTCGRESREGPPARSAPPLAARVDRR